MNRKLTAVLFCLAATPALAQVPTDSAREAEIRVSGTATRTVPAEYATITIQFSNRARTPWQAGQANAQRARAIRQALVALGIPSESLATAGYSNQLSVTEYQRDTGYVATNAIVARITRLPLVGRVIDTALTEGATNVSNLHFYARNDLAAQDQLLADATVRARQRAEAIARAEGGHLGRLLELSTDAPRRDRLDEIVLAGSMQEIGTPIQAPTVTAAVTVFGRWLFVSDR